MGTCICCNRYKSKHTYHSAVFEVLGKTVHSYSTPLDSPHAPRYIMGIGEFFLARE